MLETKRRLTWVGVPKDVRPQIRKHIRENINGSEFLVCSDAAATKRARAHIRESLWAFNTDFILARSKINSDESRPYAGSGHFDRVEKAFKEMQGKLCEDANEIVFAVLRSFKAFAADAIAADGRGHFLSQYDGKEHEVRTKTDGLPDEYYYVYRVS